MTYKPYVTHWEQGDGIDTVAFLVHEAELTLPSGKTYCHVFRSPYQTRHLIDRFYAGYDVPTWWTPEWAGTYREQVRARHGG